MPKGSDNQIVAIPNDEQPYLMRGVSVPDEPGLDPVQVEIQLHQGVWITGRVTRAVDGKPVPHAWVGYFPLLSNEFAQRLPEFEEGRVDGDPHRYQTSGDGYFRLVGLPGPAIVGVEAIEGAVPQGQGAEDIHAETEEGDFLTFSNSLRPGKNSPTAMKEINPAEDADSVRVDFALGPGQASRDHHRRRHWSAPRGSDCQWHEIARRARDGRLADVPGNWTWPN